MEMSDLTPTLPHRGGPRVLATTGALLLTPLGWVMDVIADAGFSGAEVVITHQRDSRSPTMVGGFAEESGLDVPVVHGPYMLLLRRVLGSDYREKTRRSLERAAAFGAGTLVAHAPFRWERAARCWLGAGEADAAAAENGVRFAMENLFPWRGRAFSTAVTPHDLTAYPHVVFDTSHFGVAGVDLLEAWEALAGRVCHIHLSDNRGTGTDSHAPIGSGMLPLDRFLHRVGASGYTGTITLELDCRPHLESRASLVGFLAYERVKAEALLAGASYDEAAALEPEVGRAGWRGDVPVPAPPAPLGPVE
jgi:sugar phosphate isomerase/epimerase